jgi:hypothetical protein
MKPEGVERFTLNLIPLKSAPETAELQGIHPAEKERFGEIDPSES